MATHVLTPHGEHAELVLYDDVLIGGVIRLGCGTPTLLCDDEAERYEVAEERRHGERRQGERRRTRANTRRRSLGHRWRDVMTLAEALELALVQRQLVELRHRRLPSAGGERP